MIGAVPPLLFVFREDWTRRAQEVYAGLAPAEGHGYFRLIEHGADIQAADPRTRVRPLWRGVSVAYQRLYAVPRSGLGYRLDQARVVRSLVADDPTRVIVATTDSIALPVLVLHARGRLRNHVACLSIGLGDAIARGRAAPRLTRRYLALLSQAHAVFVFAPREREVLNRFGVDRAHLMPLGIDVDWWRQPLDEPPPRTSVLAPGRDPSRCFATLVEAVESLGIETMIVGTLARKQGIRSTRTVRVLDDVSFIDLRRRFQGAAVVVIPSRGSAYGSGQATALQAMAAGRPVVMTDTGWARAHGLRPGVHFADVEPEDPRSLRETIMHLLSEPRAAEAMGQRAQEAVAASFSVDRQIDALMAGIREGFEA